MADYQSDMPVRIASVDDSATIQIREVEFLNSTRSMNNRLVVEAYKKEALQSSVSNGFAFIQQKVSVKGLKVLMDARLADGTFVARGSTAYIREEVLHTQPWAQKILQCDTIDVPFIIADIAQVEFISPPTEPAA